MKTTDDQLGHLISKLQNCTSDIVQKIQKDALQNIVDDHLQIEDAPPTPATGGGKSAMQEDFTLEGLHPDDAAFQECTQEQHIITPLGLSILIHHYITHAPWRNPSPAATELIALFFTNDLLEESPHGDREYDLSDRGLAYIRYILKTPFPKTVYVIER
jgi:hypothetical protein